MEMLAAFCCLAVKLLWDFLESVAPAIKNLPAAAKAFFTVLIIPAVLSTVCCAAVQTWTVEAWLLAFGIISGGAQTLQGIVRAGKAKVEVLTQ